jgi:hypothetical protein
VKAGGTLRSPGGLLAIDAVDLVSETEISEAEARAAGFESREALMNELNRRADGELYRIRFHLAERDPRQELRDSDAFASEELAAIRAKLDRMDRSSANGPWTRQALELIGENPGVVSTALAAKAGRERFSWKADVRKLKAMGLTESLVVGYRLTRRGEAVRRAVGDED